MNIKAFNSCFGIFMIGVALVTILCNCNFGHKDIYEVYNERINTVVIDHITDVTTINWRNNDKLSFDNDMTRVVVDSTNNTITIGFDMEIKFINKKSK